MPRITAIDLAEVLRQNGAGFPGLLGAIHSLRYTGAVTLKFLNGEPQEAEFGRPHVVVFAKPGPAADKPLDSARPPAPSSTT